MSARGRTFRGLGPPQQKGPLKDELRALRWLAPYLWPRNSPELRVRVVLAMALLIAGKLVNITVPLFYKQAVDALSGAGTAGAVIAVWKVSAATRAIMDVFDRIYGAWWGRVVRENGKDVVRRSAERYVRALA